MDTVLRCLALSHLRLWKLWSLAILLATGLNACIAIDEEPRSCEEGECAGKGGTVGIGGTAGDGGGAGRGGNGGVGDDGSVLGIGPTAGDGGVLGIGGTGDGGGVFGIGGSAGDGGGGDGGADRSDREAQLGLITLTDVNRAQSQAAYDEAREQAKERAAAAGADPSDNAQVNPYFELGDVPSSRFALLIEVPKPDRPISELWVSVGGETVAVYLQNGESELELSTLAEGFDAPDSLASCSPSDEFAEGACVALSLDLDPKLLDAERHELSIEALSDSETVEYRAIGNVKLSPHFWETLSQIGFFWSLSGHPANVDFFERDSANHPWKTAPWHHVSTNATLARVGPALGHQIVTCRYGYNPTDHRGKCSNVHTAR